MHMSHVHVHVHVYVHVHVHVHVVSILYTTYSANSYWSMPSVMNGATQFPAVARCSQTGYIGNARLQLVNSKKRRKNSHTYT